MISLCHLLRRFRFVLKELQSTFLEVNTTLDGLPPLVSRIEQLLVRVALLILAAAGLWQLVHH